MIWLFFLLLHLLITAAFAVLTYLDVLHTPYAALAAVFFAPPVGYAAVLLAHFSMMNENHAPPISIEKLVMQNEVYKNVAIENGSADLLTVPLEEALLINDSKTKRRLMLDVLNGDAGGYAHLLGAARDDEDTEVSHYAATAMSELIKENEYSVQHFEQRLQKEPQNAQLLADYIDFLGDYLSTGLLDGSVLEMYRYEYIGLIERYISLCGESLPMLEKKLDMQLLLKDFSAAEDTADLAKARFAGDGESFIMRLKLCSALCDSAGIAKTLSEISEKEIYLNKNQREIISFWGALQ